jgi:hypothetical protein
MSLLNKGSVSDLITGERDSVHANGFEVSAVHSTKTEFHLVIYNADDELIGTIDGDRYNNVGELVNAVRVQIGLGKKEQKGLGDLFS